MKFFEYQLGSWCTNMLKKNEQLSWINLKNEQNFFATILISTISNSKSFVRFNQLQLPYQYHDQHMHTHYAR